MLQTVVVVGTDEPTGDKRAIISIINEGESVQPEEILPRDGFYFYEWKHNSYKIIVAINLSPDFIKILEKCERVPKDFASDIFALLLIDKDYTVKELEVFMTHVAGYINCILKSLISENDHREIANCSSAIYKTMKRSETKLTTALDKSKEALAASQQAFQQSKKDVKDLNRQLDAKTKELNSTTSALELAEKRLAEVNGQTKQARILEAEIRELKSKLQALERVEKRLAEDNGLTERIRILEAENRELKSKLQASERQNELLESAEKKRQRRNS